MTAAPPINVSTIKAPDGTYYWADTRYFPMLSVRLFGKTTVATATTFGNWLMTYTEHAGSLGRKIIILNDFSRSKIPSSDAREVMAADANRLHAHPGFGYWIPVVPNPLLRGVLQAVLFMVEGSQKDKRTHYATGLPDAVLKAHELYKSIGQPPPTVTPAAYDFPEPAA
jgi:hypothetical protein